MKKIFTLITVACMAFAIPTQAKIFKFGAKAGLNLNNMSVSSFSSSSANAAEAANQAMDKDNQAGWFIGPTVKVTIPISGISLDASALFDKRSSKIEGLTYNTLGIPTKTTTTLNQNSIQIPINIRYGVSLGSLVGAYAFLGPQFGFNLGDKTKNYTDLKNDMSTWTLRSSSLSGNIGVGVTVLSKLQIALNYNFPLGKAGEFKTDYTVVGTAMTALTKADIKNKCWQLSAAYYF